ncbi:MAG: ribonuclease HII [Alphaproteobacteria bacterium]|nr:ribonuclease HII [Alphaproteobacteria bacterium]
MPQAAQKQRAPALTPDFSLEDKYVGTVCGIDEVGRGPLAGPVVAACVVIPRHLRELPFIKEIKDSKKLSHSKRHTLFESITKHFPYAISEISPTKIDEINILQASLLAMKISCEKVDGIDHALVDGNKAPDLSCKVITVVKGDSKSVSIAAASIIAKVYRDQIMTKLALEYPSYGWDSNAGYPTKQHIIALEQHGVTPHHRKSFGPVRRIIEHDQ